MPPDIGLQAGLQQAGSGTAHRFVAPRGAGAPDAGPSGLHTGSAGCPAPALQASHAQPSGDATAPWAKGHTPRTYCQLLQSFVQLQHVPPPEWLRSYVESSGTWLCHMTQRDLATTLWALAHFRFMPSEVRGCCHFHFMAMPGRTAGAYATCSLQVSLLVGFAMCFMLFVALPCRSAGMAGCMA